MSALNHFSLKLSALTLVILILAAPALADDNPFRQKPPIKSATLLYKYSGSETGTSEVYYQGDKRAEYKNTTTKVMGISSGKNSTILLTTPDKVIEVDTVKKQAKATGNPQKYMAQEYDKLSAAEKKQVKKNMETMGANMMNTFMGGKPEVKSGTFLGKPVDIVTVAGFTTYTWKDKGIPLKSIGSMMGIKSDMEATSVKEGTSIPASKFEVPSGIKVVFDEEADRHQREMAKQMMANLKDPEFGKNMSGAMKPMVAPTEAEDAAEDEPAEGEDAESMEKNIETLKKLLNKNKDLFKN